MSDVRDNRPAGRFEITLDDGATAFAEYRVDGGTITFPHTVVPPGHEGKGVGTRLVEAALASARKDGLKVMPRCSFFASYMQRHPDTRDLLAPGAEALLER